MANVKVYIVVCQIDGEVLTYSETEPVACSMDGGHTIGEVRYIRDMVKHYEVTEITSNHTMIHNDHFLCCDTTDGDITITLLPAAESKGHRLEIKKLDSSGNTIIIDGNGVETIDGQVTQTLANQYDCLTIISDGTGWDII